MPDINVWLALSWGSHRHSSVAWAWLSELQDGELGFCRLTQIGLLRLLTTRAVMGSDCLSMKRAWEVYDQWLRDPKVEFRRESPEVDRLFHRATVPFSQMTSPKALGDCYLVALSQALDATLVTLDAGLRDLARRHRQDAVLLA